MSAQQAPCQTNIAVIAGKWPRAAPPPSHRSALLLSGTSYITRLYTRLSPEEMTFDPMFKRSNKADVSRFRSAGSNQCSTPPMGTPCDFTACGALGLCRETGSQDALTAACACAPGATARTTFVPSVSGAVQTTISCVDKRLSYLNPGDKNAAGEALPDPCVGIDCGGHGQCVAMNMTPTCECERGYVAEALVSDGTRSARCVLPNQSVPDAFYNRRAMARDPSLPIGRELSVALPTQPSDDADPLPEGNGMAIPSRAGKQDSGCSVAAGAPASGMGLLHWLAGGSLLALLLRGRRSATGSPRSST